MNWEAMRLAFEVLYAVVVGACAFYVFVTERKRVTEEKLAAEIGAIDDKIVGHATRITRLEEHLKHSITHDDIGKVYDELHVVNGSVQELNGEMKMMRAQVELITKHMLDKH